MWTFISLQLSLLKWQDIWKFHAHSVGSLWQRWVAWGQMWTAANDRQCVKRVVKAHISIISHLCRKYACEPDVLTFITFKVLLEQTQIICFSLLFLNIAFSIIFFNLEFQQKIICKHTLFNTNLCYNPKKCMKQSTKMHKTKIHIKNSTLRLKSK